MHNRSTDVVHKVTLCQFVKSQPATKRHKNWVVAGHLAQKNWVYFVRRHCTSTARPHSTGETMRKTVENRFREIFAVWMAILAKAMRSRLCLKSATATTVRDRPTTFRQVRTSSSTPRHHLDSISAPSNFSNPCRRFPNLHPRTLQLAILPHATQNDKFQLCLRLPGPGPMCTGAHITVPDLNAAAPLGISPHWAWSRSHERG